MKDIIEAKLKYGSVFITSVGEHQIKFRLLTWREFDIYSKIFALGLAPRGKVEDSIFRETVIDTALVDNMNDLPAGIVSSMVGLILRLSGNNLLNDHEVDRFNRDMSAARKLFSNNVFDQLIKQICSVFPALSPLEIENLPFQEVIRLAAMAEKPEAPIEIEKEEKKKKVDFIQGLEDAGYLSSGNRAPRIPEAIATPELPMTQEEKMVELLRRREAAKKIGRLLESRGERAPLTIPGPKPR